VIAVATAAGLSVVSTSFSKMGSFVRTGLPREAFELVPTLYPPIRKRNSGIAFVPTEEIGTVGAITEVRFSDFESAKPF